MRAYGLQFNIPLAQHTPKYGVEHYHEEVGPEWFLRDVDFNVWLPYFLRCMRATCLVENIITRHKILKLLG